MLQINIKWLLEKPLKNFLNIFWRNNTGIKYGGFYIEILNKLRMLQPLDTHKTKQYYTFNIYR